MFFGGVEAFGWAASRGRGPFWASCPRSAGVWQQHLLLYVGSRKGAGEPLTDWPSRAALSSARILIVICVHVGIFVASRQATLVPGEKNAATYRREVEERLPSLDEFMQRLRGSLARCSTAVQYFIYGVAWVCSVDLDS